MADAGRSVVLRGRERLKTGAPDPKTSNTHVARERNGAREPRASRATRYRAPVGVDTAFEARTNIADDLRVGRPQSAENSRLPQTAPAYTEPPATARDRSRWVASG